MEKGKGITTKDLIELVKCIPKPLDVVTIECPQWYKDYMEKKYGKTKRVGGD